MLIPDSSAPSAPATGRTSMRLLRMSHAPSAPGIDPGKTRGKSRGKHRGKVGRGVRHGQSRPCSDAAFQLMREPAPIGRVGSRNLHYDERGRHGRPDTDRQWRCVAMNRILLVEDEADVRMLLEHVLL